MAARLSAATHGVYIIAATPFLEDGSIDESSTDRMVEFYVGCGVHGITILGVMGESQKLTHEEALAFARRVIGRCADRVPIIVGVSQPGLKPMVTLAREVMALGAAGVMLAPPSGLRSDEEIFAYGAAALEALGSEIPVCLQDFPQGNGVYLSVQVIARLWKDFPQLVVFKHEDCPGLGKLTRLRTEITKVRQCSIVAGNGGLYFPLEMRRGADGAMTGFAYPEMLVEVYCSFRAGTPDAAEDLFDIFLPLVRYEQQPGFGLAVRKEILHRRGVLASARTRTPGPRLTGDDMKELDHLIDRLDRQLSQAGANSLLRTD